MSSNSLKPVRRSIRLKEFDYSGAGAYFITLCTVDHECLFGKIINGEMALNALGTAVAETWAWLGRQYAYVTLDVSVIMPNHTHGIIFISSDCAGGSRTAPTTNRKPLGRLVGAFKTVSTKTINELHDSPGNIIWQRNYYEHVLRTEKELDEIRQYIANNPLQWELDRENPGARIFGDKKPWEI